MKNILICLLLLLTVCARAATVPVTAIDTATHVITGNGTGANSIAVKTNLFDLAGTAAALVGSAAATNTFDSNFTLTQGTNVHLAATVAGTNLTLAGTLGVTGNGTFSGTSNRFTGAIGGQYATFNGITETNGMTNADLTASTVPYTDANKKLTSSAVTPTELSYVGGGTSSFQTQLGTKAASNSPTLYTPKFLSTAAAANNYVWTSSGTDGSGGWAAASAASQTPWTSTINGATNNLTNVAIVALGVNAIPGRNDTPSEAGQHDILELVNAAPNQRLISFKSYLGSGITAQNNFHWYTYGGTPASPSATTIGAFLMSMGMRGYDGSVVTESSLAYQAITTENWGASAHGAQFQWGVTPNGSITRTQVMVLNGTGLLVSSLTSSNGITNIAGVSGQWAKYGTGGWLTGAAIGESDVTSLVADLQAKGASNAGTFYNPKLLGATAPTTNAVWTSTGTDGSGNWTPGVLGSLTQTNFISGQVYTNNSGTVIYVSANAVLGVAAVSGNAVMSLEASGTQTNQSAISTLVTSLAMNYTNYLAIAVTNGGTYVFTNRSTGSGNTASIIGGQIVIPGTLGSGSGGGSGPTNNWGIRTLSLVATNVTVDVSFVSTTTNLYALVCTTNTYFVQPTNLVAGASFMVDIRQDSTGARTVNFNTNYWKFPSGQVLTITTNANAKSLLSCVVEQYGTNIYVVQTLNFQ